MYATSASPRFIAQIESLPDGYTEKASLLGFMSQPDRGATRIVYSDHVGHLSSPSTIYELLDLAAMNSDDPAVCIVENISPTYIEALSNAWNIEPFFFARHIDEPARADLWQHRDWSPDLVDPNFENMHGLIEYVGLNSLSTQNQPRSKNYCQRHVYKGKAWPWIHVSTCISYCRVNRNLYLLLVDAPFVKHQQARCEPRPTLRFRYTWNRGGILLPHLYQEESYSILELMRGFFRHAWHIDYMCTTPSIIPSVPFLYMLSSSLWMTNLEFLDREIKRISFVDVRRPNLAVTDALHTRRQDLDTLVKGVDETITFTSQDAVRYFAKHLYQGEGNVMPTNTMVHPLRQHEVLLADAAKLDKFLMDTFQLLMSTMSVQDSQASIKLTQASVQLTQLAFIYAPLTLVTGIFGMNIRELNGAQPRFWWCIVLLVIFGALTGLAFWIISRPGMLSKSKESKMVAKDDGSIEDVSFASLDLERAKKS